MKQYVELTSLHEWRRAALLYLHQSGTAHSPNNSVFTSNLSRRRPRHVGFVTSMGSNDVVPTMCCHRTVRHACSVHGVNIHCSREVVTQAANLKSFLPKTGSGLLNTQPPLDALSGSSAAHVTLMCSVKPLTMSASTTRWHHGQALPT